jgi:hypothetical protein
VAVLLIIKIYAGSWDQPGAPPPPSPSPRPRPCPATAISSNLVDAREPCLIQRQLFGVIALHWSDCASMVAPATVVRKASLIRLLNGVN